MAGLQQQLDRLRVPHPAVQGAAVAGVFAALQASPGLSPATRDGAITQCLCLAEKVSPEAGPACTSAMY